MASGNQQRRPRLLGGVFALTFLALISQVQASAFGRLDFYNAMDARGVATPQEPVLLAGFYPRSLDSGSSSPMEISWRYTGGGSGPNGGINLGLIRRQTTGDVEAYCNQGMHVCRAFDVVGCCNNNAYCIITNQGAGKCCPIGSVCGEDPCSMTSTFCSTVVTVVPTALGSASQGISTSTSTGCCIRACSLTMHLCDLKFGGYCCGNDAVCLPNKMCQATPNPSMPTSNAPSATVTQSCSTGSFACVSGGCCPNSMVCTEINNVAGCAQSGGGLTTRIIFSQTTGGAGGFVTDKPTHTASLSGTPNGASNTGGTNTDSTTPSGLSTGAIAGIGIGAAVAVLAAIALGAFFFIRHRKNKAAAAAAAANTANIANTGFQQPPPQNPPMGFVGYPSPPPQQGPYYGGTQYPQGYYPAPQASPQLVPPHGYYDSDPTKQGQNPPQHGGAVLLPNTIHTAHTSPTAELPAQ